MRILSGTTDQYIYFVGVDATSYTARKTGLTGFTVWRSRNGAAGVEMTTPTVNEVSAANLPGVYELLLDEDMTIGAGNDTEEMVFHIEATGMVPVTRTIELFAPQSVNVTQIDGNTAAAQNLSKSARAIIPGQASGTPTTTSMDTDLTGYADSELIDRVVVFYTGTASGQMAVITSYANTNGVVGFAALQTAPASGDDFVIL